MAKRLSESDIRSGLDRVPGWKRQEAEISRRFEFPDFPAAMTFVNTVADLAETANHHPDIDIRWNKVQLRLSTHSAGGLTALDFSLAEKIDTNAGL